MTPANLPHLLHELKQHLLFLSGQVEDAVAKVVQAIMTRDSRLAREVIAADTEIDNLEVRIEGECQRILALHQPVAGDLRFVVATLKINNDLERMGDLAKKIGKNVVYLCGVPPTGAQPDFREIAEKARSMVKRSIDAFVNADAELARQVMADDDAVDQLKDELYEELRTAIRSNPDELEALLKLYGVTRNLERLGDMATHVAEEVIFIVEGDIVRHSAGG
ncbi:MAG: phosphate signaling complex protein PhoU [Planctomycetaceae bacterium]|nr:phosphate signaling complex protein PhoU [Planctomycetaceae bacterium]